MDAFRDGAQLRRWLRRGWPLLLVPLAFAPFVLFAFDVGIDTSQRFVAFVSMSSLAWVVALALLLASRSRRLGSVLVRLPRARYSRLSIAVAVLFLPLIGLEAYSWLAYRREFPWSIGWQSAIVVQNLMLARAGFELRESGVCDFLNEWRWDELRHWRWQGSDLQLHFGFWSPVAFPVPEDRRADVETALTRHTSAKP